MHSHKPSIKSYGALLSLSFVMLLSMPATSEEEGDHYVTIGGQKILSRVQQMALAEKEARDALPKTLRSDAFMLAMKSRDIISPPPSSPILGDKEAPVTVYEFTDLSCTTCYSTMKTMDSILNDDAFKGKIKRVYIHMPEDKFTPTNANAFYSKIAQQEGDFWAFRQDVLNQGRPSDTDMVHMLNNQNITMADIRKNLRENTREFYQELDQEAAIARRIVRGDIPFYLVNGIALGSTLTTENLKDFIIYEIHENTPRDVTP